MTEHHPSGELYLHADDFGISDKQVDKLVRLAKEGMIASVSVFAADRKLAGHLSALLGAVPGIRIAVHLNFVEGPSVLGHDVLPDLTDTSGYFDRSYLALLIRGLIPVRGRLYRQLREEAHAQIETVRKALPEGAPLAIDTHQHTFGIPVVCAAVLDAAAAVREVREARVPAERLRPYRGNGAVLRRIPAANYIKLLLLRFLLWTQRRRIRASGLVVPAFSGVLMTDGVEEPDIRALIPALRKESVRQGRPMEILFHPARIETREECPDPDNLPFVRFNMSARRDMDERLVRAAAEEIDLLAESDQTIR